MQRWINFWVSTTMFLHLLPFQIQTPSSSLSSSQNKNRHREEWVGVRVSDLQSTVLAVVSVTTRNLEPFVVS
ncbi:hypothetical protein Hanom_Chr06g00538121 [Helianthus anomalus]